MGGMTVQWSALAPHSQKVAGLIPTSLAFLSVDFACSLCVCMGSLQYSGFHACLVDWQIVHRCKCGWLSVSLT